MNTSVHSIPTLNLILILIPVVLVCVIYLKWIDKEKTLFYATARMIVQLMLVGFVLVYVFEANNPWMVGIILVVMLIAASWIALHPLKSERIHFLRYGLIAIAIGCLPVLLLVIFGVVRLNPWYEPRYVIPLAGMIFANAMTATSLGAERFQAERQKGASYIEGRAAAYRASLLPVVNHFFAVGIVSLPGMMTGQILSGVSPVIAVRYQTMVMCMVLGASGISTAIYLKLIQHKGG
jgi:putative ABC transport system permease protein